MASPSIAQAIHAEIAERRARCAGRPDRELLEHLLVAVQRERIAAVGYDIQKLSARLAQAPLAPGARDAIGRVITQIWIDENQHARYVLGLLLRQRGLAVQLGAQAEHIEGGVGGWMTAVEQHSTWRDATAERLVAAVLDAGGRLLGRIPVEVRDSLGYGPLRAWCLFSADAEESAQISFRHMRQLADEIDALASSEVELPGGFFAELARMERDEAAHQRVFLLLADLLGDDDGLRPGVSERELVEALRSVEGWGSPLASDPAACRQVLIERGRGPDDKLDTFDRTLETSGLFAALDARARALGLPRASLPVAIKVDLMLAYHRDDPSAHVDPALIERLVDRLLDLGYASLSVCDAQNLYARFYRNRSIEQIAAYVGLRHRGRFRLVDLATEQVDHRFSFAMGVYGVGRTWRDAAFRVSFAKLKTHPTAVGQLCLRNVGTVIPQNGDLFFSDRLSDFSPVVAAVLHDFPVHFALIDGYSFAADGLMGVIADPTPKHPHLFLAGDDLICVDHTAMALMGERDPGRAPDLRAAIELLGDPRPSARLHGDPSPIPGWDRADAGLLSAPLAALASPVYASLSRRGALFMADLDPVAFPPIDESPPLAAAREALRALLGISLR